MPSLKDCILSAQSQGHITPEDATDLIRRYDAFLAAFRQTMGEGEAAAQAKAMLAERLDKEGLQRKRAALLQLDAAERLKERLFAARNARGEADPARALTYLVEYFGELEQGGGTSVEGRSKAIVGLAHGQMEAALHEFRRGYSGRRLNAAKLDNVVREAFGEDSGDPAAKALAKAWADTAEDLRQRYNQYGGMIGHLEKWGLPQRHDGRAIRAAGFRAWRAALLSADPGQGLDTARMRDHLTGRPLTPDELETSLQHVYDSIVTEGWAHRDPSFAATGKGALVKQHAESRFLVFKNADAWLAYQRQFGEGDPFAAMMGHINVMARDIAAMQVLGPNPDAMLKYLFDGVMKQAQALRAEGRVVGHTEWLGREIKDPVEYARAAIHRTNQMWSFVRGATNAPVSSVAADTVAAARQLVSSAALGSAILSAPSDLGFQTMARQFAGLPVNGMLTGIVRQFGTASTREAVRAGLILDSAAHTLGENARYFGAQSGRAWANLLADRVMTWQGLSAFTQAEKHAFGLTFQGVIADHAGQGLAQLPPALQRTLRRYGIDEELWGVIRLARLHELEAGTGATILRPGDVLSVDPFLVEAHLAQQAAAAGQDGIRRAFPSLPGDPADSLPRSLIRTAAERYLEMILAETEYAVPSGTVRSRTVMLGDNQPGTLPGELLRSAAQFKSFGASVWQLQVGRMVREFSAGGPAAGAVYATQLLVYTTLLGALSMQLKGLSKGQDPRPVDDPKFWGAAMLQGGGLGIFGDFFFSDINRMGGSWAATMAGPLAGRLNNVWQLTGGNVTQYANHDKTNFGRELVNFVRSATPGSSLWYTRLAWERIAMDRLQRLVDPQAYEAFRRRRSQVIKDQRTDYWWGPGQSLSDARMPDWGNAAGRR